MLSFANHPIHIFNGFLNPHGGSELEALALYALLEAKAEMHLWACSSRASPALLSQYPIRRISLASVVSLARRQAPDGGTYIFVGAHWRNKLWPYLIQKPSRLVYVYNTFHPKVVALTSQMPTLLAWPRTEYVVISPFQQALANIPGEVAVHSSPIDIDRFTASPVISERSLDAPLVIGRMSRDTPDKHDPRDMALYRELAAQGYTIQLQGATCIASSLADTPAIRIFPEGQLAAEMFLRGLDIFYYRSGTHVETFGRVVFEAMACGLPVVCHAHGGYADWIRHGENGFLFDTTEEACAILQLLAQDAILRKSVGRDARATVEAMHAPEIMQERAAFYLR
ncbi:MAG: glycosyltransferase family 4 protein [Pseudomonadota bacterium]